MFIGAVITAILTPQTGKGLQDELIKKTNDLRKKMKDFDLKDINYHDTKCALKEKLDDAKQMIEDFDWSESKEKVQKKFEEVTCRLSEIKDQLTEEEAPPVAEEPLAIEEEAPSIVVKEQEEIPSFVLNEQDEMTSIVVKEEEEDDDTPHVVEVEAPFTVLSEAPFSPFSEEKEPPFAEVKESLFSEIKETPFIVKDEE